MTKFSITANGTNMGVYQADTIEEAIVAYVKDAGYASVRAAADATGQSVEDFLADILTVEEVK